MNYGKIAIVAALLVLIGLAAAVNIKQRAAIESAAEYRELSERLER